MRPYRGMTKEGEWVYGWYMGRDQMMIWEGDIGHAIQVIPETVAQSTGMKDCKRTEEYPEGQEIYEEDTVSCQDWWDGIVSWQNEGGIGWCVEPTEENKHRGRYGLNSNYEFIVIGNIDEQ